MIDQAPLTCLGISLLTLGALSVPCSAQGADPQLELALETLHSNPVPNQVGFAFASIIFQANYQGTGFYLVPDGRISTVNIEAFIALDEEARSDPMWGGWQWLLEPDLGSEGGPYPNHLQYLFPEEAEEFNYYPLADLVDPQDFVNNMDRVGFNQANSELVHEWCQPILKPFGFGAASTLWDCDYFRWPSGGASKRYWRRISADGATPSSVPRSVISGSAWARVLVDDQARAAGVVLPFGFFTSQHYRDLISVGLVLDVQGHGIRGRDFEIGGIANFPQFDNSSNDLPGLGGMPPHRKSNTPKRRFPILGKLPPGASLTDITQVYGTTPGAEPILMGGDTYVFKFPYILDSGTTALIQFGDGSEDWVAAQFTGYDTATGITEHGDLCALDVPAGAPAGLARIKSLLNAAGSEQVDFEGASSHTYTWIVD